MRKPDSFHWRINSKAGDIHKLVHQNPQHQRVWWEYINAGIMAHNSKDTPQICSRYEYHWFLAFGDNDNVFRPCGDHS